MTLIVLDFALAGLLAAMGGALELVTRHPAQPGKPLGTRVGVWYIAVNALAGVAALYLGVIYGLLPDIFGASATLKDHTSAYLTAGFASLVILRSTILTVKVDGKDVNFGPSFFITALLNVLQREIERELAPAYVDVTRRAQVYGFDTLVDLVVPAVRNAFADQKDTTKIERDVAALRGGDGTDATKAADLARVLYEIAGEFLLTVFDDLDKTLVTEADADPFADEDLSDMLSRIPISADNEEAGPGV